MTDLLLSALDRSDPSHVRQLARRLEIAGYRRLWLTEHRTPPLTPSPSVLVAVAAASTARIRVGSAGVKLRYISPTRIAEEFRLLESLFPGRIDLGTVSGVEKDSHLDAMLLDGRLTRTDEYGDRLALVAKLARCTVPASDGYPPLPDVSRPPEVWSGALRRTHAERAASLGIGLAYHRFQAMGLGLCDGPSVADWYRDAFTSNAFLEAPTIAVVCCGCCSATFTGAQTLWRTSLSIRDSAAIKVGGPGRSGGITNPDFLGSPSECREQLEAIAHGYKTREVVVHCFNTGVASQIEQHERLASEFVQ